jgi:hypothetical protein
LNISVEVAGFFKAFAEPEDVEAGFVAGSKTVYVHFFSTES